MSLPYLDLAGVKLRSLLRPAYFDDVEGLTPGYTAQSISTNTSTINSQMRKRYGGVLPWGQSPPVLVATLEPAPAVALVGRPTLGSIQVRIEITTGGLLGVAIFKWSQDNGVTWTLNVTTGASVPLGTTGMSALFPAVAFTTNDLYSASPPVPETILQWLTSLVTEDVAIRHGVNTNDPLFDRISKRVDTARTQIQEAADTKDGLWDLPLCEDAGSAVDTGAPLAYSEASPYTWTYRQQAAAARDCVAPSPCPPNRLVGS